MCASLDALRTLHAHLSLPPVPISQPHHFPIHLLPTRASEETPGANAAHEKLLARVLAEMALMPPRAPRLEGEEEGEGEGQGDEPYDVPALELVAALEVMKDVEPELGLLEWLGNARELVRPLFCIAGETGYDWMRQRSLAVGQQVRWIIIMQ